MSTATSFFSNEESAANWLRLERLTQFSIEHSKRVGRTLVMAAPEWLRLDRTPSFTFYQDGKAYDFGGSTPRSYSAFQLYLIYKGLSPDLDFRDPRRVAAAREFWPEKYSNGTSETRQSKQGIAEQKLQRDLQALGSRNTTRSAPPVVNGVRIAGITDAWDELAALVEAGPEFRDWILGRGFTMDFIESENGNSLFPLQLPRRPSLHQIDLFTAAGLLKPTNDPATWSSPFLYRNGCYLVSRFKVHGFKHGIVTGVRKRFFDSRQPKEAQVITIEDCVLPGVKYLWFGFDWCTVNRARDQVVILTESHLDHLAVKRMLQQFAEENSECQRLLNEHRFLVLGLNGVNSYSPKVLDLVDQAIQLRIALDADSAGKKLAQRILTDCEQRNIPAVDCTNYPEALGNVKDPNEALKITLFSTQHLRAAVQHFSGKDFS